MQVCNNKGNVFSLSAISFAQFFILMCNLGIIHVLSASQTLKLAFEYGLVQDMAMFMFVMVQWTPHVNINSAFICREIYNRAEREAWKPGREIMPWTETGTETKGDSETEIDSKKWQHMLCILRKICTYVSVQVKFRENAVKNWSICFTFCLQ